MCIPVVKPSSTLCIKGISRTQKCLERLRHWWLRFSVSLASETYLHVSTTRWIESFRQRTVVLLSEAYTAIPLALAKVYLGLPVDELLSCMSCSSRSLSTTKMLSLHSSRVGKRLDLRPHHPHNDASACRAKDQRVCKCAVNSCFLYEPANHDFD
jgi:hypothetical protein